MKNSQFLGMKTQLDQARFVVIPVAYEGTVSYGKGASLAPQAIIDASIQLEKFDEERLVEGCNEFGIFTLPEIKPPKGAAKEIVGKKVRQAVEKSVAEALKGKKTPVVIGGEHSITPAAVKEVAKQFPKLSVLQIDAHADLRNSYQGSSWSHACAMRRTLGSAPVVQVGIRSISKEEFDFAQHSGQVKKIHFAHELKNLRTEEARQKFIKTIMNQLSDDVYVTIDVDGLDPSIMPATGTPEPGGLHWNDLIDLLSASAKHKKIRGFDVVELAPIKGMHAPDFICAKLVYKLMNLIAI
jgi:agmatinase